jgi:hypothetical protein
MYDTVLKNGWLRVTNFDDYDAMRPIFETPTMSMKQLQELYDYAFRHFYMRPSYIFRMWRKGFGYGYSATMTYFFYLKKAIKAKFSK